jgi:hypothetical protein
MIRKSGHQSPPRLARGLLVDPLIDQVSVPNTGEWRARISPRLCLTARLTLQSDSAAKLLKIQTMIFHATVLGSATSKVNKIERPHEKFKRESRRRSCCHQQLPRGNVVLSFARFRPNQHTHCRWLENARHEAHRSGN